jgi:predicted ABC-type exoprotein transport system permease subunit
MKTIFAKIWKVICNWFDNPAFNLYLMLIGMFVLIEGIILPMIHNPNLWHNIAGYGLAFLMGFVLWLALKALFFKNKNSKKNDKQSEKIY